MDIEIWFRYFEGDRLYSHLCEATYLIPMVGDYVSDIEFNTVCDTTIGTEDSWETISLDDKRRLRSEHFRVKARQWYDNSLLVALELSEPLKENEY